MEGKNKKNNNNKKLMIGGVIAIVVIIAIILIATLGGGKSSKKGTVHANVGEPQWMSKEQTLEFTDGGKKVTFTIQTDDNLVKQEGDYEYTISYVLKVNDTEYTGTHRFGNGYSVHNEDNSIPYKIDIMDFEDNSIQVSFSSTEVK